MQVRQPCKFANYELIELQTPNYELVGLETANSSNYKLVKLWTHRTTLTQPNLT